VDFAILRVAEQPVVARVELARLGGLLGLFAVAEGDLFSAAAGDAGDPAAGGHTGVLLLPPPNRNGFRGHRVPPPREVLRAVSEFPPPLQNVL
jgi:hypothetical protein